MTQQLEVVGSGTASESDNPYRTWHWCLWAGWAYLGCIALCLAVLGGFLPPPHEDWSPARVTAFFLEGNAGKRAAMVLYLVTFPLYVTFSMVVARLLAISEGRRPLLHQLEFYGGVATSVCGQLTGLFWLTAAFHPDQRSDELNRLLYDLGWFSFDLCFVNPVLQMAAIAAVVLRDRSPQPLFPPWFAWFNLGIATTQFLLVMLPFAPSGPMAWDGLVNFWVVLNAYFVWLCVTLVMSRRAVLTLERRDPP